MDLSPDTSSDAIAKLTAQYQELADRAAVAGLLDRYAAAIDSKDWVALDGVFAPDAELDYSSVGGMHGRYPEVKRWLMSVLTPVPLLHHYVSGAIVDLRGDEAVTRCNLFNPMGAAGDDGRVVVRTVAGRYHDRVVRTTDGWRIAHRRLEHLWSMPLGIAGFVSPGMLGEPIE